MELDLLELAGDPYRLGYAHGERYRNAIVRYAEERIRLAGSEEWTGSDLSRQEVLALAQECLPAHEEFTPDGVEELQGMADATGLTKAELLIVGGFTDFVDTVYARRTELGATRATADDCTAVLVPGSRAEGGGALFGQTWDMHASSAEHVLLLRGRPHGLPEFLTFTSVGCVGMIGMNEAGLVVGINNLMAGDGATGVMWTFVVRELLKLETVAQAVRLLEGAPLAGGHNYLLLDRSGAGANVEAMGGRRHVTKLEGEPLVHTNHCLRPETQEVERERTPVSLAESGGRLERSLELLGRGTVTPGTLQRLAADEPTICVSPRHSDDIATCGAAIMRPATGEFWAVKGAPSRGSFRRYTVPA
ncbi:MAG TPA: C45 family peptidase [Trueperaceae bacterium]